MEKMEQSKRSNSTRIVIGAILVILAGLILADNFDFFGYHWRNHIFTWQTLLIVLGVIFVTKRESKTTGIILIAVGTLFLVARYYHFPVSFRNLFWPAVLLIIGLSLIFSRSSHRRWKPSDTTESHEDYIDDLSIFGGSDQHINSQNFRGGRITNIFGGSTIDLSDAQLSPGSQTLELLCIFGGSKIAMPSNWKIRIETASVFGGISDKRKINIQSENNPNAELIIKGLILFGGTDIKSL